MNQNQALFRIHFVGIGGIGMSGIAQVFHSRGYQVSGSDLLESDTTRRLRELGIPIALGHHAANIQSAQVVVISSAVPDTNPEVIEAKKRRIPVIPRAEMLGELMREKTGIAIAGTHGKTTTTSLVASIFTFAGCDPTVVIGGKVDALGGSARHGTGRIVIAEADESDGSFVHLPATYALVTNIDNDHLDHFGSMASIEEAFIEFLNQIPFYGSLSLCLEDPGVRRILGRLNKPYTTYGLNASECDHYATDIDVKGFETRYVAHSKTLGKLGIVKLRIPGIHNVLNSLGALSIGLKLGIEPKMIFESLEEFNGVRRRFEMKWKNKDRSILVIDDYGHHPTEIRATLKAARQGWSGRVLVVFQPHRYTRTAQCWNEFLTAFDDVEELYFLPIYSAGEEPLEGVTSEKLLQAILNERKNSKSRLESFYYDDQWDKLLNILTQRVKPGDLVVCLGAGNVTKFCDQLVRVLDERSDP